ncbi:acyl-CoA synthetase (AMP-forming)/AMP-acid ligase II [Neobacillus cucumis]|nr:AMP-binding protein [Neobacillus cucumis]MBM7652929.1 acyl-CoA synthetase (AMP-forming)/AMP-acid ligase II [Neobacillus cucumis]
MVSGDNIRPGYYQNQEETNRVLKDSWLHTGDMGRVDDEGYVYIVDRKKDLIIRDGFNVYSRLSKNYSTVMMPYLKPQW